VKIINIVSKSLSFEANDITLCAHNISQFDYPKDLHENSLKIILDQKIS